MSPLFGPFATGFLLGASLIIAIGAQNAFLLRQGLRNQHVLPLVLICAVSDAILIAAGVAGLGTLITQSPRLVTFVTFLGALFLFAYGFLALRRASSRSGELYAADIPRMSLKAAVSTCLAFTFLNPHVYLDTVVLVGALSARHQGEARLAYAAGAMLASFFWFFSLGYGARLLALVFEKRGSWRALDIGIGILMWLIALRLLIGVAFGDG